MPTCPRCAHTWGTRKLEPKPLIVNSRQDTSQMSDTKVYAYYKRTSHIEDVRFFSQHTTGSYRNAALGLLAEAERGLPRKETFRRLRVQQVGWFTRNDPPANEQQFWAQIKRLKANVNAIQDRYCP